MNDLGFNKYQYSQPTRRLYVTERTTGHVTAYSNDFEFKHAVAYIASIYKVPEKKIKAALLRGDVLTAGVYIIEYRGGDEDLMAEPHDLIEAEQFLGRLRRNEGLPHEEVLPLDDPDSQLTLTPQEGPLFLHTERYEQCHYTKFQLATIQTALKFFGIAANPHDVDVCKDKSAYYGLTQIIPPGGFPTS